MPRFRFEELTVWQKSVELGEVIYRVTGNFPRDEKYGLTSQMRRAVVSISSNLAEGNSRATKKDYARFIEFSYSSLMELVSQLYIAFRLELITKMELVPVIEQCEEIARMLSGLRRSLRRSD